MFGNKFLVEGKLFIPTDYGTTLYYASKPEHDMLQSSCSRQ